MRNQNLPDPQTAVDLTNCDREPIHLLGGIQPIGFLLALAPDWTITRASANLDAFFPAPPPQPVGMPLDQVFSSEAVHSLRNRVAMLIGAGLLVAAAAVAFALVRRPLGAQAPGSERMRVEECVHCPVSGPQLHPADAPR